MFVLWSSSVLVQDHSDMTNENFTKTTTKKREIIITSVSKTRKFMGIEVKKMRSKVILEN